MKTQMIRPQVGMMSCIGVHGEYPLSWGNYFAFSDGPRCLNMWAENLQEFVMRNPSITEIEITTFAEHWAIVTDKRIPKDWLYEKLCMTGIGWPAKKYLLEIAEFTGLDMSKEFCGCETDEMSPSYYSRFTYEPRKERGIEDVL